MHTRSVPPEADHELKERKRPHRKKKKTPQSLAVSWHPLAGLAKTAADDLFLFLFSSCFVLFSSEKTKIKQS